MMRTLKRQTKRFKSYLTLVADNVAMQSCTWISIDCNTAVSCDCRKQGSVVVLLIVFTVAKYHLHSGDAAGFAE